jgi:PAS domain-containing protein
VAPRKERSRWHRWSCRPTWRSSEARELLQEYLIREIEQKHLEASPNETAIVAKWAAEVERRQLREENHNVRALLDQVQESATLLEPCGRILYCNLVALERLREVSGAPRREIIGKTLAELGVSSDFLVGSPLDQLVQHAREHESRELSILGRAKESHFDAVYRPDGTVGAVAVIIRDIHDRRLAQTRLALLAKLSALVGTSDGEQLAEALVRVPIPDFADWCTVNLVEGAGSSGPSWPSAIPRRLLFGTS